MRRNFSIRGREKEQGQTIAIVALSLLTLFAMAALAIDVASLYSARGDAQKAADAAALAGAKAFSDSGYTTNPAVKTLAENMMNAYVSASANQNNVAGSPPTVTIPSFDDTTHPGNPQVTVKVQQSNLPIFFAKILGATILNVSATATAEAYNPSNSQVNTGNFIPTSPSCVKPLAIPNSDTNTGNPFVDTNQGTVAGSPSGESFTMSSQCNPRRGGRRGPPTTCTNNPSNVNAGNYVPVTPTTPPSGTNLSCPSCGGTGSPLQQSLQCCDTSVYQCGKNNPNAKMDINYSGYTNFTTFSSIQACAIQPFGLPDTLDLNGYPNNPMQITAGSGPAQGQLVNTSSSIMTFPIFDTSGSTSSGQVTVVGFAQVFVNNVSFNGQINGTILNVVGCSQGSTPGTPIQSGGPGPIAVRLIHQ